MSSLRFRKPSEVGTNALLDRRDSLRKIIHRRRWRRAFTVIYFTRALESMSKPVLGKKTDLLRSLSYVVIHVVDREIDDSPRVGDCPSLLDVDRKILSNMVREKRLESLAQLGGIKQLASNLITNPNNGLSGDAANLAQRADVFGRNKYNKPPVKNFLSFVLDAFKDMTITIPMASDAVSLVFGIKHGGLKEGWYNGWSIIITICLVVVVSALSNCTQGRRLQKLLEESSNVRVEVMRDGRRQPISTFDIVVGDVVCLKIGDQVPADGLFVNGNSLKVDESVMTGESDHIEIHSQNPFLLSGTEVVDGYGRMMVIYVGMNSAWGEMMSSVSRDLDEGTARLNKLTSFIGKVGLLVAALVLLILMIRYFTGHTQDEAGHREFSSGKSKSGDVMDAVVRMVDAAVTIMVVAIPEGLSLAITLTLACSRKCTMGNDAMVRKLSTCDSMGSATTICTDKSRTLTLNDLHGHTEFTSVVTVLRWGQCVYKNIQKFIQFQLTLNLAAVLINFVAVVSSGEVPFSAVQLLWVNLIVDTMGALALATERPTIDLLRKPLVGRSEPLINRVMWRNLTSQALYQVIVLLTLQFKGSSIFGVDEKVKDTIIFNCFVLCQVFNVFNARKLEEENIFEGIHKNKSFLGIVSMTIILQVVMLQFLNRFADTARLEWGQWGACIGLAAFSWPIGWLVKCIPVSGKKLNFFPH